MLPGTLMDNKPAPSLQVTMSKSFKSDIAERVIQSILNCRLRPGERLGEQELADLFGVSRTGVREALFELQARGFVEVRPRQGWFVVEPSFEDARETYAARRIIEPGMLRDAGRPLQSVLQKLRAHVSDERQAIAEGSAGDRSVVLADFHVCLAECLGNRLITTMMVDLSARTTLVSALYQSATEAQRSNDDHADIVTALEQGDTAAAERLMREHIDKLAARLDHSLAQGGTARERMLQGLVAAEPPARAARR